MTNVSITATMLHDIPLGCKNAVLPDFLMNHTGIKTLLLDRNHHIPYSDNLCVFRAIAISQGDNLLQTRTKELFSQFMEQFPDKDPKHFRGVKDSEFVVLEDIAEVNIVVYSVDYIDGKIIGELLRRSANRYDNTVTLLRYNKHVCYVPNPKKVFHNSQCQHCDKFFDYESFLQRHLINCEGRIRHEYPGGVYKLRPTIFEKLEEVGIHVPHNLRLFKNLAVFDFESICVPNNDLNNTDTVTWIGKHIPISVSLSSNLIKDPVFVCDQDPAKLVKEFVKNLELLADRSKEQMNTKMKPYMNILDGRIAAINREIAKRAQAQVEVADE